MNKKYLLLICAVAVVVIGIGVVFLMGKDASAPASESSDQPTTQSQAQSDSTIATDSSNDSGELAATITFTDEGFTPSQLTVKKGATVTVKNESKSKVQFSSDDHPTHRLETEMNLRVLSPGESGMFIVTKVGAWGFHDHIDDSKTGTLTVTQ